MATYDVTTTIPSSIKTGDILNCPYCGRVISLYLPPGIYQMQCWGAQGCDLGTSYPGGKGGYAVGTITFLEPTSLFIYAGGAGASKVGGFNGGGGASQYGGGGGSSDIRIGIDSLYARVIVAGGGGGSCTYSTSWGTGGAGGGTTGTKSNGADTFATWGGYYGTQTGVYKSSSYNGNFGSGGSSSSGGGGGWYGGDAGYFAIAGGGGSGYVYTSSTYSSYPSGCLLNSSYYLTDASTIAGDKSFVGTGGASETGHSGSGYVRITAIEVSAQTVVYVNIDRVWKEGSLYQNLDGSWKEAEALFMKIDNNWKESD